MVESEAVEPISREQMTEKGGGSQIGQNLRPAASERGLQPQGGFRQAQVQSGGLRELHEEDSQRGKHLRFWCGRP